MHLEEKFEIGELRRSTKQRENVTLHFFLVEVVWQIIFRGLKGSWEKAFGAIYRRLEVLKKLHENTVSMQFWVGETFLPSDIASREDRLSVKVSQQWNHLGLSQKVNTIYCRSTTHSRFCPHLKNNRKNTLKVLPRAMASASKTGQG